MSGRRLSFWIAAGGLAAGLILALAPTWHTYPAGVVKDGGYVEKQTVACSVFLVPKNPHVRGHDDECDAERVRRGVLAVGVVFAGLLLGGIAFAGYTVTVPPRAI